MKLVYDMYVLQANVLKLYLTGWTSGCFGEMSGFVEVGLGDDIVYLEQPNWGCPVTDWCEQLVDALKEQRHLNGCVKAVRNPIKELLMANYVRK